MSRRKEFRCSASTCIGSSRDGQETICGRRRSVGWWPTVVDQRHLQEKETNLVFWFCVCKFAPNWVQNWGEGHLSQIEKKNQKKTSLNSLGLNRHRLASFGEVISSARFRFSEMVVSSTHIASSDCGGGNCTCWVC